MRPIDQIRPGIKGAIPHLDSQGTEAPSPSLFEEFQDYLSKIVSHSTISNQSVSALNDAISAASELPVKEAPAPVQLNAKETVENKNKDNTKSESNSKEDAVDASNNDYSAKNTISQDKESEKESQSTEDKDADDLAEVSTEPNEEVKDEVESKDEVVAQSIAAASQKPVEFEKSAEVVEFDSKEASISKETSEQGFQNSLKTPVNPSSDEPVDPSIEKQISEFAKEAQKPSTTQVDKAVSENVTDEISKEESIHAAVSISELPTLESEIQNKEQKEVAAANLKQGFDSWNTVSQTVSQYLALTSAGMIKQAAMAQASVSSREVSSIEAKNSASPFSSNPLLSPQSVAFQTKNSDAKSIAKQATRPLSKATETKTLERVEQVLKEAVKSRDGKTISFRLDPPNLGKVQVDVSFKDGALRARIVPESQQVGNILREKSYELVNSLRKLGLNVEKISLSISSDNFISGDSGLGSSSHESQSGHDRGGNGNNFGSSSESNEAPVSQQGNALNNIDHWVA